ncbi:DUF2207 domain-containing protein [Candidatus Contubernalis alkaliaceticus]|uniref:DUF2207 domain-containing protein n=1 Tax=Candidatus Contubernalis alkaliaceticus TaxID=338645 RepID=UPI001F4BDC6E|nr:DUF2207 domain-containing protein [Candidatus Contubernalis alkalaceticus]UNC93448.1 DUF2207 domain-containing protein [Candidatus Contubernalis alkalaceticus]
MRRWRKGLVTAALIILVVALWGGMVQAKSYKIPEVYIEAEILEDGTVRIQESRTFDFSGSFTWLEQWVFKKGNSKFDRFYVREGDIMYEQDQQGRSGQYSFLVLDEPDKMVVKWFYQAVNEQKTFTLGYDAHHVVLVHEDIVDFYYKFVGDYWEIPSGKVRVAVILPEGIPAEEVKAWGHGPLQGEVTISGNNVFFEVDNLPGDRFLEGRILFPSEFLPGANEQYRTGRYALENILEEEAALAAQANRDRFRHYLDWALAPVIFLLALGGVFYFWRKYGKEFKPDFQGDYYRELPADYSPAEMAVLYRFGVISPDDLTATIMDLARRGYMKIEEGEEKKSGLFKKTMDYRLTRKPGDFNQELAPHELDLINYLFSTIAVGENELNFSDIEKHAKKNPSGFQGFYSGWQSTLKLNCDKYEFFDPITKKGKTQEFAVGAVLIIVGFLLFFVNMIVTGFAMLLSGVVMLVAAAVLRRRSRQGVTQFAKWKAFRKFLLDFSQMDRAGIPSLVIWEHYLVYAISLGIAEEVIKQLNIVFPNLQEGNYRFGYGWYYLPHGGMGSGMPLANFNGMTSRLQQSFLTAVSYSPSSSSGSGGGGGFSGGGGGGFGGGGGRAG